MPILLLYTSLTNITRTVVVEKPTVETYLNLYSKYPQTLSCPCSTISINYGDILSIQYSFHQVCTSDFISKKWTNYLTIDYENTYLNVTDFRWIARQTFQTIRSFCELINTTLSNSLSQFYSKQYVSVNVVSLQMIQSQSHSSVSQFRSSTTNSFLFSLIKIRDIIHVNALFSAHMTNFDAILDHTFDDLVFVERTYGNCSCGVSPLCVIPSSIYDLSNTTVLFTVPGIYAGCYLIESTLQSTLECFYDQTCVDRIQSFSLSSQTVQITSLNQSFPSLYSVNSTVQQLIDQLMIEQWNASIVYSKYYAECSPLQCTYSYQARNDAIYIITTLVGLIGGLVTILKIVVPRFVKLIRRRRQRQILLEESSTRRSNGNFCFKINNLISTLNLFPSTPPTTNAYELRNQTLSTRLFLLSLFIIMTILLLYTSLVNITKTVIVKTPAVEKYLELYSQFPETLSCPCSAISISYGKFFLMNYTLHQVCSSDFVSDEWINYLTTHINFVWYLWNRLDFRLISGETFRGIKILCESLETTISQSLNQFYSNEYISGFLLPSGLLETQTKAFLAQFRTSTTNSYLVSLSLVRDTVQTNAVFSAKVTNYELFYHSDHVHMNTNSYDSCSCSLSSACIMQSSIYDDSNPNSIMFTVPGMYAGCYIIESLLASTLECFYNETCITQLQSFYQSNQTLRVTPLNSSFPSLYSVNSAMQVVINNLMIEEWNSMINYSSYFDECSPLQCTYSYQTRNDMIYIVTTLIGLVGGLITILKIVVPRSIQIIRGRKIETNSGELSLTLREHLKNFYEKFNLFPSIPPTTNDHELRNQKISTKLFVMLLILIVTILLLYTSLANITKTVVVEKPTVETYLNLYSKYPQTLSCPCSTISINYGDILSIQYSFHQVCTSDFIKLDWIYFLDFFQSPLYAHFKDFLLMGPQVFQGLRSFCLTIKAIIDNNIDKFYKNQYISAYVIPLNLFQSQVSLLNNQFRTSLIADYLLSLSLIHETTDGNALQSVQMTNYELYKRGDAISVRPSTYDNCSCTYSSSCLMQSAFYNYTNHTITFSVPGINVGCYFTEALLLSNLQCFYSKKCVNHLKSLYTWMGDIEISQIDTLSPSLYTINSSVQELINQLMIEEWNLNIMYNQYYSECSPLRCTYSYQARNDAIYIITTLVGLVGGLITILKIVVPRFVAVFRRYALRRSQVNP
ncbi:unnamed protein product [Adineta ricciae]|uniref:Uncharacterized protein n=1 Tax=Adineta ricciae TaxID=249248 RepID=A0A815V6X8_ADIRI|nr:unnamed protein product [Adineta ricciae]